MTKGYLGKILKCARPFGWWWNGRLFPHRRSAALKRRQAERDQGLRDGTTTEARDRLKALPSMRTGQ